MHILGLPYYDVAPLVGAWIEITSFFPSCYSGQVAPLVGAWIEIKDVTKSISLAFVAPLVGAWIEIIRLLNLMV